MLLKRLIMVALLAAMAFLSTEGAMTGASSEAPEAQDAAHAVELTVFLFDNCGGCGTDSPGCGNCQDIVRYHAIIKEQLGDRLYDGTIKYRMYNCRIEAYDRMYDGYHEAYGMPQELYGYLPCVFIGDAEGGVWLASEVMLDFVGEYLDKYLESDDLAALQQEIDAARAEVYAG